MRYSLISTGRRLTDAHVEALAQLLSDLEIPSEYLRKNSPARQTHPHQAFNSTAQKFIALIHTSAHSESEDYSLADLVAIIRRAIVLHKGKKQVIDSIIACLAYTLRTQQFIAVFLEFAPDAENFDPKTGWCRGSSFYDFFFSALAEPVAGPYLDALCHHIFTLVKSAPFTEEQINQVEQELKAKEPMAWEDLSEESRQFTKSLITPSVNYLVENQELLPSEIKNFLYQCRCYLSDFRRNDVNPLKQLGGLFFVKFTLSEIIHPDRTRQAQLSPLQIRAIKIISANIQRQATIAKDERLLGLIENISVEATLQKDYLPFGGLGGDAPAMRFKEFEAESIEILKDIKALPTPLFEDSEATPRDSQADSTVALLLGHEEQPLLRRRSFLARGIEWNRCNAGLLVLGALLTILGASFANSALLEAEGLLPANNTYSKNVGPVGSSFIGGLAVLLLYSVFFLIFVYKCSPANETSESRTSVFHRRVDETESEASAVEEENSPRENTYQ